MSNGRVMLGAVGVMSVKVLSWTRLNNGKNTKINKELHQWENSIMGH